MSLQRTLTRSLVMVRTWPVVIDMGVGLCALALFIAIVHLAAYWMGTAVPVSRVSENARSLPMYAFYSVMRIGIAYVLSLVFAIAYGYIAARNARAEAWMIAVLDILQSIPVLSFLPPVLLAMIALIPHRQLGIELGVILLIFTGQVWNLAFSFYSSMKAIPKEMIEASRIYRYSGWQRFWQLEMPYATIGLIWNSIISVANGWFALMACEMFQLKNRNFELPGLGSYIQNATYDGDLRAILSGIATIVLIVVATDQLIWRPLIAWSEKFKFEQVETADHVSSPILTLLQRSRLVGAVTGNLWARLEEPVYRRLARSRETRVIQPIDTDAERRRPSVGYWFAGITFGVVITWGAMQCALMLRQVSWGELRLLLAGAAATFLRVNASLLLSAVWTVPVGVAIGFSPKLARVVQPIAQVLASVPATAFFPILLIGLLKIGGGLGIGSIALMLLGTQWYPVQRDCGSNVDSFGSEGGGVSLQVHTLAAMDDADLAGNLSLSDYGNGDRVGRGVECVGLCRVCQHSESDHTDDWPGSTDRHRHSGWEFSDPAFRDDTGRSNGGHDESPGVEAALSPL